MFARAVLITTSLAAACALTLSGSSPVTNDARDDANAAVRAMRNGDLAALDRQLSGNSGGRQFAYYFASQVSPRELGDAVAAAGAAATPFGGVDADSDATAAESAIAAPADGFGAAAYERVLHNLSASLSLATHGAGPLKLPGFWADDFAAYSTASRGPSVGESGIHAERADQDVANKQNLLLLLSRGRWSTDFLQTITRAYWDWEHVPGNSEGANAWPVSIVEGAKYATAPNGTHLTDGLVALMAALTANPEAAGWAFSDFQPETVRLTYGGAEHPLGRFAHFVFLEHRYAQSPETGVSNLGITASRTALLAATEATGGSYGEGAAGPLADVLVLQAYEDALSAEPDDSEDVVGKLTGFLNKYGHAALDLAGMVPVVGETADLLSGAWYAVDGDWSSAGLSVAAVVPFAGAAATAAKVVKGAKKGGQLVDRSGAVIDSSSEGGRLLAKGKSAGDGIYEFDNPDDFLAALDHAIPGVTYRHGDTTYEVSADGRSLNHLSGPDRRTIAKDRPHPTAPGRNQLGHCISPICKEASMVKEEQGLKDYEKMHGMSVDRTSVRASVEGVENGRYYDGLVRKSDGTYDALEVKSGRALRGPAQRAFDERVTYKTPATAVLNGERIQITSVKLIRV